MEEGTSGECAALANLVVRSAWAKPADVLAGTRGKGDVLGYFRCVGVGSTNHCGGGTTGESAALASDCSVGVGSISHCGGGHDM